MLTKRHLLAILFTGMAWACSCQAHALAWPEACGSDSVQFKVKTAKKQSLPPVETGKGQVIFVESLDGEFPSAPIVRFGVDGAWTGAARGLSYLAVSVPAGEHHFCASRQSAVRAERENVGVATLHIEAGKTYFLNIKIIRSEVGSAAMQGGAMLPGQIPGSMTAKQKDTVDSATFNQLSDDEAHAMLKDAALSTSSIKN